MARVKKIPQRMCVGCQEMKSKKELIRIVRTPDEGIQIDSTGKKSGRGAYLCPDVCCLQKAAKERRLEKALERQVSKEIYDMLKSRLGD